MKKPGSAYRVVDPLSGGGFGELNGLLKGPLAGVSAERTSAIFYAH